MILVRYDCIVCVSGCFDRMRVWLTQLLCRDPPTSIEINTSPQARIRRLQPHGEWFGAALPQSSARAPDMVAGTGKMPGMLCVQLRL